MGASSLRMTPLERYEDVSAGAVVMAAFLSVVTLGGGIGPGVPAAAPPPR